MPELDAHLPFESAAMPVTGMAADYVDGHFIAPHTHRRAQFLYATSGVMVIETAAGRWVVPPTRGVWLLANVPHTVRMRGVVNMKTLFVNPDAAPGLPTTDCVLDVSPLLRELILAASILPLAYVADSRDGRLMRFLLDELRALPVLPFHLPWPTDPRLNRVCTHLAAHPDDPATVGDWATTLAMSSKTFHRQFQQHTGITFGRWRQQARLLLSLEQLAQGDKILHVALQHGYSSQSAYSAMFKRHFGVSPSDFYR
ncbi:helix-turn-helix transcriptional regulator [Silvimonas sp.]|uniref:AraC family transcriptional regulator n=1 Tax=Silvimonas sp. TaxID=2650811 RepID=UPI00283F4B07|nr:helix-turn-helix transcriptional regulator [Silvimonas sp.]MDR3426680.1 helix-turn-helix transcriptional regulator [Silvimonas sp.]